MARQADAFHKPLDPKDTEKQTVGCRHTNPDIFLTEDDIRIEERKANENVIITEFPEPVGE